MKTIPLYKVWGLKHEVLGITHSRVGGLAPQIRGYPRWNLPPGIPQGECGLGGRGHRRLQVDDLQRLATAAASSGAGDTRDPIAGRPPDLSREGAASEQRPELLEASRVGFRELQAISFPSSAAGCSREM